MTPAALSEEGLYKRSLRRRATYASCSVAILLIFAKLFAFVMTDSVAMLSSLIDSSVDMMASLVTLYGVANALRPRDRKHRFGYGKAEALAALAQAVFIIGLSLFMCFTALERFFTPREVQNTSIGYMVMSFSIVMTFALLAFQRHVVRSTGSMAIGADMLHYTGDVATNVAVMVALFLQQATGLSWFDPLFAIGIAIALMTNAGQILSKALKVLMDRELSEDDRTKIIATAMMQEGVLGTHDLRTRSDGEKVFMELHIEMHPDTSLRDAHEIVESTMNALYGIFPDSDILIHMDPAGMPEARLDDEIDKRSDDDES